MSILKIEKLKAKVNNNEILKDINLNVNKGEIHAIMGPNGAGKSTLAAVLTGKPGYEVIEGKIEFAGKNLFSMSPEIRAREGMFLSFQYPFEVPGLSNLTFIKTALNEKRKYLGLEPIDALDFKEMIKEKSNIMQMDDKFLNRSVNEGFSGGEKKRNEIFQMAMLEPKLAILDETDSGLDIDSLRIVSEGLNKLRNENNAFIIITHYQRLLDYIVPDFVHILYKGTIVKSGDKSLALELEAKGYDWIK